MHIYEQLVELALAERESKNAGVFLCVRRKWATIAPRRSWKRSWKLGMRIVTTIIVCK